MTITIADVNRVVRRRGRTAASALLVVQLGLLSQAHAQAPQAAAGPLPRQWLQGYARTVAGEWIVYPWAYPGQVRTLLSRATDGRMAVEWEGEPPTPGPPAERITYLWHAGTASGYGAHRFTFTVNGRAVATFTSGRTTADREWSITGEGGTLSFLTTRVGRFDELFGLMWFTAPRAFFGASAPRFTVVGEAAASQDYYLGPQEPVEEWTRVQPEEAVFADGQRAVRVAMSRVGEAQPMVISSAGRTLWSGAAGPGHTTVLVPAGPNVEATIPLTVSLDGVQVLSTAVAASVVASRTIHLLPHSHIDIGYSDPQPEVERKQWKNLRDAVALGAATAAYPPQARFKWNVEGLWSVESYLAQASADDRRAFVAAVGAGTIGLQANYTNLLTGLASPAELRHWTDGARRLQRDFGVGPIRSAMQSDIPGLAWTTVSALAGAGVRYFSSGPNYMPGLPDGGDRIGGTLKALGDRPFWWVSPSGKERLLFWMAGRGYSWFHGLNTGAASEASRDAILDYVRALHDKQYRYDMIQVRYTVGGDNGPVDPNLPDFVKRWNETYASPRLAIDTTDAMFAEFERRHGADLPVMSGDMTPYWEDGALSTASEEATVRVAARRLEQAETLATIRGSALPPADVEAAWRSVLLWHEHTWGAADSISAPDRADVVAQWEYKRRFAIDADRASHALLASASGRASGGSGAIANTSSWPRSGLVLLPPEQSRAGDRVVAGAVPLPSQRLRDGRLAVWVAGVPSRSFIQLRVVAGAPRAPAQRAVATERLLASGRVRIALDPRNGVVTSLTWTGAPGHDFSAGAPGLFRYLYVAGRNPAEAVAGTGATITVEDAGPLVASIRIDSHGEGTRSLTQRLRVVAGSDLVFSETTLDKLAVRSQESAHLAFPFHVPGGVVRAYNGSVPVQIDRDQLPGSCRDYIGVHGAIDVSGPAVGISLVSLDAPLIEPGAITDERQGDAGVRAWPGRAAPGTTLYAYLLNNYWHTNYKADQNGSMSFRFVLRPHAAFDAAALRRLSDEQTFPLLPLPASARHP